MVSGMVRIALYPLATAMAARPMPVLPEVGSMMVAPAEMTPRRSASSSISFATRSLTLPAGLKYSSLRSSFAFKFHFFPRLAASTRGVFPTRSRIPLYIFPMMFPPKKYFPGKCRFVACFPADAGPKLIFPPDSRRVLHYYPTKNDLSCRAFSFLKISVFSFLSRHCTFTLQ